MPSLPKRIFKPRDTGRARELRHEAPSPERVLWRRLSNRKLSGHKFSRQIPVGPYFADFLCRALGLVVEIDGPSHDVRTDHDDRRNAFMAEQGYRVLRFSNEDVTDNLEGVLEAIASVLAAACPPPTPPACGRGEDLPGVEVSTL